MRLIVNNRNIKILRLNNNGLGIEGMINLLSLNFLGVVNLYHL